jgi:hypothetical protein
MRNPFQVYVDGEYFRSVATAMAAETLVVRKLRDEGAQKVEINFNGRACADFTRADLARPVWGKPETFLIKDIERGAESLKHLPPAVRGKNKRAVVAALRGVYGGDEATAVKAMEEIQDYLR